MENMARLLLMLGPVESRVPKDLHWTLNQIIIMCQQVDVIPKMHYLLIIMLAMSFSSAKVVFVPQLQTALQRYN